MDDAQAGGKPSEASATIGSDPTLADPGRITGGEFPDTAVGTQMVLYPTDGGGVDLRWQIEPADIAYARAGFRGTEARPMLRLHRIGTTGDDRLLAYTDLGGDDAAAEHGHAHYDNADAAGLLQAEIGLASADGGWLLIARSNELRAAAPIGVDFLHPTPAPAAIAGPVDETASTAAHASAGPAAAGRETDAPAPVQLAPEFPLVEPHLSEPLSGPQPQPLSEQARAVSTQPDRAAEGGAEPGKLAGVAAAQDGLDRAAGEPAFARRSDPNLAAGGQARDLSAPPGAGRGQEPPPGGVVPRLAPRQPSPGPSAQTFSAPSPAAGSGPLRPQADGATLSAALVVHGSAPPNSLLDLGGHPYRVGPGGRFVLHIPIRDHQLIRRVLATLPQLPVEQRDDGAG
ncbi:hypothetical protein [Thiohalocapsa halophila]|nr:hypothetical protein [Thiohalocapsa halophila]